MWTVTVTTHAKNSEFGIKVNSFRGNKHDVREKWLFLEDAEIKS